MFSFLNSGLMERGPSQAAQVGGGPLKIKKTFSSGRPPTWIVSFSYESHCTGYTCNRFPRGCNWKKVSRTSQRLLDRGFDSPDRFPSIVVDMQPISSRLQQKKGLAALPTASWSWVRLPSFRDWRTTKRRASEIGPTSITRCIGELSLK
jgi:hypothetical protein